ncbi:MAG: 4a-hydroxytetrahydrobiopterin dehydratase [Acidimicrobiia bacterium]|nr:4a-hydroxytetrahydrobiopterin dehydratase [Acidimicrobiia bacterium]
MTESTRRITPDDFHATDGLSDWRVLSEGACALFRTETLADSVRFVEDISAIPGIDSDRPAIDLRSDGVTVRLVTMTREHYGLTTREVELARAISTIAQSQGLVADPSAVQTFLVVPGAPDTAEIMPFWRAVLGYDPRPDSPEEDLVDLQSIGPPFWFEPMQESRPGGEGAIHVAVWVPYDQAEARVAEALAAGGRLVYDKHAPAWWTLADPAGNEADIATTKGR